MCSISLETPFFVYLGLDMKNTINNAYRLGSVQYIGC